MYIIRQQIYMPFNTPSLQLDRSSWVSGVDHISAFLPRLCDYIINHIQRMVDVFPELGLVSA